VFGAAYNPGLPEQDHQDYFAGSLERVNPGGRKAAPFSKNRRAHQKHLLRPQKNHNARIIRLRHPASDPKGGSTEKFRAPVKRSLGTGIFSSDQAAGGQVRGNRAARILEVWSSRGDTRGGVRVTSHQAVNGKEKKNEKNHSLGVRCRAEKMA